MLLKEWNERLQILKKNIKNEDLFEKNINEILNLHDLVYLKEMSQVDFSFEEAIWDSLTERQAKLGVNEKGRTVVYSLWHTTRIEDITMNCLVGRGSEVLDEGIYMGKIGSSIMHTGNSLTTSEILEFSKGIDILELKKYRMAVGKKSQEIIRGLKFSDLKRKTNKLDLEVLLKKGSVENHPDSIWLLEFWKNKDVAGIIFMPCLRHHMVHINEALKAKRSIK